MSTDPQSMPGQEAQVPTCYRHPGRETYVRCTRCDRYICPECMRDAAVGHQCVECVREGNKSTQRPRTVTGGRVSASSTPMITYALLAINVVVFFFQQADVTVEARFALIPLAVADGEFYRLGTSAFLHYGLAHLLLNMWALFVVGQQLEGWLGRTRFILLYALSALGGSVVVYLFAAENAATAGASGAVFGLFGAMFVMAKRMNFDVRPIAWLIGLNLVITFAFANISWQAHVGGLVTGSLIALAYAYAPRDRRTIVQATATVAAVVVFAAVIAVRTTDLTSQFG